MRTLKTIHDLIQATDKKHKIDAENALKGILKTPSGWKEFNIHDDLKTSIADDVSELLGGWESTKITIFKKLRNGNVSHWGLKRVLLEIYTNPNDKRKKCFRWSYCAGKDYNAELQEIRNDLKK